MHVREERGAAAVEFAIILPLLLILLFGILEFGWLFNQQVSLSNASREAARYYAVHLNDTPAGTISEAQSAGQAAAPSVDWAGGTIEILPDCGTPGEGTVTAKASIPTPQITGVFSALLPAQMTSEGKTICGG